LDSTMPRGKPYSADLCHFIYELSFNFNAEEIAEISNRPLRTIHRIIAKGKAGISFLPKPRRIRGSYSPSDEDMQVKTVFLFSSLLVAVPKPCSRVAILRRPLAPVTTALVQTPRTLCLCNAGNRLIYIYICCGTLYRSSEG